MELAGRTLTLETGRLAKQAGGSVLVRYGETTVLVAAVTLFTVVSVVILEWTDFRITLPDLKAGLTFTFPAA
ncbi:MAG: hypothetical protein M1602_03615, partial [Firmicutes bacterium]|nr:hypothetical protein [Bacillota bacterium]